MKSKHLLPILAAAAFILLLAALAWANVQYVQGHEVYVPMELEGW
jgi:hypothetical protein